MNTADSGSDRSEMIRSTILIGAMVLGVLTLAVSAFLGFFIHGWSGQQLVYSILGIDVVEPLTSGWVWTMRTSIVVAFLGSSLDRWFDNRHRRSGVGNERSSGADL